MIQEARRQLPSWMVRSVAADQTSISRVEVELDNNQNDSHELDTNSCQPQKKGLKNQHDVGAPLRKDKSSLFKKCEAKSSKRKSNKQDNEGHCDDKDKSVLEQSVNIKAGKGLQHRDELHLLKKCRASRKKRISNNQCEHGDQSDNDAKDNVAVRKEYQGNGPRRKKQKAGDIMNASPDIKAGSISRYDEFTVDDLVSIAQEYVDAAEDKELPNSLIMSCELENQPLQQTISQTGSDKCLSADKESSTSVIGKQPYPTCSLTEPSSGGSIINPSNTGDPARDMLDLFLGPLLRTTEEVERKTVMSEKLLPDNEASKKI